MARTVGVTRIRANTVIQETQAVTSLIAPASR